MKRTSIITLLGTAVRYAFAQTRVYGVSIPPELAYLLPPGYSGNITQNFIDTTTSNVSINAILTCARNATFYSYDAEFDSIVGSSPTIRRINASNSTFTYANEGGAWVPALNQVYFTGSGGDPQPYYILNLNNYTIAGSNPLYEQPPPTIAGSQYFDGLVYLASLGLKSASAPPAIYAIDPTAGSSSVVLNSYGGVPLNPIDDLAWVKANASLGSTSCVHPDEDNLFFTILDVGAAGETQFSDAVFPNAVFRYTPSTKSLQAVVSRGDILAPNGIYADPSGPYLYVTDVASTARAGPGSNSSGSPAVYKFDLDRDCNPVNKRLFAISRSGYADGIKVDNYGRVWTAEFNGIVVRDPRGRELGVFNSEQLVDTVSFPISNFGLAGDKLVLFAGDQISVLQLGQNVTDPDYSS